MKNILLTIRYDGTEFSGWQKQLNKRTVQGELEKVLETICKCKITLNGTGRTDSGVHALKQRANFKAKFSIPTEKIPYVANRLLSKKRKKGDLEIAEITEVDMDFHARFDAKGKEYIYNISCGKKNDIFLRNQEYQLEYFLDIKKMKVAAKYIVGNHDFKCFQASGGEERKSTVRNIYELSILENYQNNEELQKISIHVVGDGFLYNMVRIIVGTLVEVGQGKIKPDEVKKIIQSKERENSGHTAPPWGLYMAEVFFDEKDLLKEKHR